MEISIENYTTAVRELYELVLNQRKFELLDHYISEEYVSANGEKGTAAFLTNLRPLITAFPDIKWTLTEVVAGENKVFLRQEVSGTHEAPFQQIPPTFRKFSNQGMAIYEFRDGKIIRAEVLTDRLGFLQQLGQIPDPPIAGRVKKEQIIMVDQFVIPRAVLEEFTERMEYNRRFIRQLPGFLGDEVLYLSSDEQQVQLMTLATWKDEKAIREAKEKVNREYERIGFDPAAFTQGLGIVMERKLYKPFLKE